MLKLKPIVKVVKQENGERKNGFFCPRCRRDLGDFGNGVACEHCGTLLKWDKKLLNPKQSKEITWQF